MSMNKKAEISMMSVIIIVLVLGLGAYALDLGGFKAKVDNAFSKPAGTTGTPSGQPTTATTANCPSSGTTTLTLNVQDALTSSATNVNAEYYVFGGNKLLKEGSTGSDGTVDISLTCGSDYKILLVNTSASTSGAYPKVVDYQARVAADSLNAELATVGTSKILGIENPSDPSRNANVSIVAGQSVNFDLKFTVNSTEDAINRPIIMCQANISAIKDVQINSFSDGTKVVEVTNLPKRLSATSNYQYFAFEYPALLTQAQGVRVASGSITAQGSVNPVTNDKMTCLVVDQAMWKKANYKTSTGVDDGFVIGPENTETLADVGAADSATAMYYWGNSGGY